MVDRHSQPIGNDQVNSEDFLNTSEFEAFEVDADEVPPETVDLQSSLWEEVRGDSSTPDENVAEDVAISAGIVIPDSASLHTADILQQRDTHRWELELESAEDYPER